VGGGGRGLREELGLGADVFLVGAVGRLHPSKGMDVLISAFRAAAPAHAALAILGEGPQRAELERLRGGDRRIHLLGYRSAVGDCLRDLDLFVSPSREESFGLAILEAMGAGLPVLATAAEGPGEFLLDQPVELVPPGAMEPLAAALREAAKAFVAGRRTRVAYDLTAFDPATRVASIAEFYGEVMAVAREPGRVLSPAAVVAAT
jgi:glycosyltransferase involved in cell wall biosynthesis